MQSMTTRLCRVLTQVILFLIIASGNVQATPANPTNAGAARALLAQWQPLTPTNAGPGARFDFALHYNPATDKLYLFGGRDNSQVYNDVWALDLADLANLTWQPVAANAPVKPAARHSVAMVVDDAGTFMYVATGQLSGGATKDDIWRLDLTTETWEELSATAGPAPIQRYALAAGLVGNDLVLSHGFGSGVGRHNDTWRFDTATNRWQVVVASATSNPVGRCLLDGVAVGNTLVMHGGCSNGDCTLDDTWLLDVDSGVWTEVVGDTKPAGRRLQGLAYAAEQDLVVLFGGQGDSGTLNDLWGFTMSTQRWQQLASTAAPDAPTARHSHKMIGIPATANWEAGVLVYGGRSGNSALNDLWFLRLTPTQPHFLPVVLSAR